MVRLENLGMEQHVEPGSVGMVGLIFRYNYVHDLIRNGEANYTYGMPTLWK